ncbi:MAG: class I SAM-dependent methyltransferase [Flavobacteriales bacterium]|nr:class I SAM-dependent methyltransferase [Flavobacteriales bacterium]
MDRWFSFTSWCKHQFQALGPHGIHSPYVYALATDVLRGNEKPALAAAIETLRQSFLSDQSEIEVLDLGAGTSHRGKRTVASIARHAVKPRHQAEFLYRLAKLHGAHTALELGTCLGITSLYLSEALRPGGVLHTIEGAPTLYALATGSFSRLGAKQINAHSGAFDSVLPQLLPQLDGLNFVFIDGNHQYEAVLRYVSMILPYCQEGTMIIIDDIYWSRGMQRAWEQLRGSQAFHLTIDLYYVGLLITGPRHQREHFRLKWPLMRH